MVQGVYICLGFFTVVRELPISLSALVDRTGEEEKRSMG